MIKQFSFLLIAFFLFQCAEGNFNMIDINGMRISENTINEISDLFEEPYKLFNKIHWVYDPNDTVDFHRIDTVRNGLYFERISEVKALSIYKRYRKRIISEGNYIFLSNESFGGDGSLVYDLVILRANDQFQAIKLANTNGRREGIGHQAIFDKLLEIHHKNELEIYGIDEHQIKGIFANTLSNADLQQLGKISPRLNYQNKEINLYWVH